MALLDLDLNATAPEGNDSIFFIPETPMYTSAKMVKSKEVPVVSKLKEQYDIKFKEKKLFVPETQNSPLTPCQNINLSMTSNIDLRTMPETLQPPTKNLSINFDVSLDRLKNNSEMSKLDDSSFIASTQSVSETIEKGNIDLCKEEEIGASSSIRKNITHLGPSTMNLLEEVTQKIVSQDESSCAKANPTLYQDKGLFDNKPDQVLSEKKCCFLTAETQKISEINNSLMMAETQKMSPQPCSILTAPEPLPRRNIDIVKENAYNVAPSDLKLLMEDTQKLDVYVKDTSIKQVEMPDETENKTTFSNSGGLQSLDETDNDEDDFFQPTQLPQDTQGHFKTNAITGEDSSQHSFDEKQHLRKTLIGKDNKEEIFHDEKNENIACRVIEKISESASVSDLQGTESFRNKPLENTDKFREDSEVNSNGSENLLADICNDDESTIFGLQDTSKGNDDEAQMDDEYVEVYEGATQILQLNDISKSVCSDTFSTTKLDSDHEEDVILSSQESTCLEKDKTNLACKTMILTQGACCKNNDNESETQYDRIDMHIIRPTQSEANKGNISQTNYITRPKVCYVSGKSVSVLSPGDSAEELETQLDNHSSNCCEDTERLGYEEDQLSSDNEEDSTAYLLYLASTQELMKGLIKEDGVTDESKITKEKTLQDERCLEADKSIVTANTLPQPPKMEYISSSSPKTKINRSFAQSSEKKDNQPFMKTVNLGVDGTQTSFSDFTSPKLQKAISYIESKCFEENDTLAPSEDNLNVGDISSILIERKSPNEQIENETSLISTNAKTTNKPNEQLRSITSLNIETTIGQSSPLDNPDGPTPAEKDSSQLTNSNTMSLQQHQLHVKPEEQNIRNGQATSSFILPTTTKVGNEPQKEDLRKIQGKKSIAVEQDAADFNLSKETEELQVISKLNSSVSTGSANLVPVRSYGSPSQQLHDKKEKLHAVYPKMIDCRISTPETISSFPIVNRRSSRNKKGATSLISNSTDIKVSKHSECSPKKLLRGKKQDVNQRKCRKISTRNTFDTSSCEDKLVVSEHGSNKFSANSISTNETVNAIKLGVVPKSDMRMKEKLAVCSKTNTSLEISEENKLLPTEIKSIAVTRTLRTRSASQMSKLNVNEGKSVESNARRSRNTTAKKHKLSDVTHEEKREMHQCREKVVENNTKPKEPTISKYKRSEIHQNKEDVKLENISELSAPDECTNKSARALRKRNSTKALVSQNTRERSENTDGTFCFQQPNDVILKKKKAPIRRGVKKGLSLIQETEVKFISLMMWTKPLKLSMISFSLSFDSKSYLTYFYRNPAFQAPILVDVAHPAERE